MLEVTEDSSAATAWWRGAHNQDHGSVQDTEWTHSPGSLRVNMSQLLQRAIQREGYVSHAYQTTQRRTEQERRLWYRHKLLTKKTKPPMPGVGSGWVVSRFPPGDGKGHCRDR